MSASITSTTLPAAEPARYDAVARALHWSMALLIVVAFALGLGVDAFPKTMEDAVVQVHVLVGVSLVVLLGFRVFWRLVRGAPPPVAGVSPLVERLGHWGHLALYLLMAAVLAAGLATLFLRGRGIELGFMEIPSPVAANRTLARPAKEIHELLSFALMGLAGLHMVAAIWHQVVLRDGTMARMSGPGRP
ncbi:cytochrome b [Alsobacter sp. R-9]